MNGPVVGRIGTAIPISPTATNTMPIDAYTTRDTSPRSMPTDDTTVDPGTLLDAPETHEYVRSPWPRTGDRGRRPIVWPMIGRQTAVCLALCLALTGCWQTPQGAGGQFLVVRDGDDVYFDRELWQLLSGDTLPSERQMIAAGCQATLNNYSDESLDKVVFVGTNPRLIRAGELVDWRGIDAELASTIEHLWLSGEVDLDDLDTDTVLERTEFERDDIEDYLTLAAESPSSTYAPWVMVIAYSASRSSQFIRVVDVEVDDGPYRPTRGIDATVLIYEPATTDRLEYKILDAWCEQLVDTGLDALNPNPIEPPPP